MPMRIFHPRISVRGHIPTIAYAYGYNHMQSSIESSVRTAVGINWILLLFFPLLKLHPPAYILQITHLDVHIYNTHAHTHAYEYVSVYMCAWLEPTDVSRSARDGHSCF